MHLHSILYLVICVWIRALTSREFHSRVVGGHYSIRSRVFFFISKNAKTSQSQMKASCLLSKQSYHNWQLRLRHDKNVCEIKTTLWYLNGMSTESLWGL